MEWIVEAETLSDLIDGRFTAETKPLVRCKDCIKYEIAKNGVNGWCNTYDTCMDSYDFCSYSERREKGEER